MNATKKNVMVLVMFFILIIWMAAYYSTVLQKQFQAPMMYGSAQDISPEQTAGLI